MTDGNENAIIDSVFNFRICMIVIDKCSKRDDHSVPGCCSFSNTYLLDGRKRGLFSGKRRHL